MRLDATLRLLFVFYCFEAGIFLLTAPWFPSWDRVMIQLPYGWLRELALATALRASLSAFGTVHLVWGLHDLIGWFLQRRTHAGPA